MAKKKSKSRASYKRVSPTAVINFVLQYPDIDRANAAPLLKAYLLLERFGFKISR